MPPQPKKSEQDQQIILDQPRPTTISAQEGKSLREDLTALALRFMIREDRYVINCSSDCINKPDSMDEHHPSYLWRARCGWKYSTVNHKQVNKLPDCPNLCSKCWGINNRSQTVFGNKVLRSDAGGIQDKIENSSDSDPRTATCLTESSGCLTL